MERIISMLLAAVMTIFCSDVEPTLTDWEEEVYILTAEVKETEFHEDKAVWHGDYGIDLSEANNGIVVVSCTSDQELKLGVNHNGQDTYYAIPNDGTPFAAPLSGGSGHYEFIILVHIEDTKYGFDHEDIVYADVSLSEATSPYLYPNGYVPYDENSLCVKKAEALAKKSKSRDEFINNVSEWVRENVAYDSDYIPDLLDDHEINPDSTMRSGKGICLDSASLLTAMLRSQGVPAKLVFGHVGDGVTSAYHAWTEAYTEDGWEITDACTDASFTAKVTYSPEAYY